MKILRQGDVLLVKIETIPDNLIPVTPTEKGFILAEGEATGHHHAIRDIANVAMFAAKTEGKLYLILTQPNKLEHEEHSKIDLPIGNYEVIRQREYHPDAIRNVAD